MDDIRKQLHESQAAPHGVISIRGEFALPSSAHLACDAYYRAYHPQGYGTALTTHQDARGYWIVEGSRLASCE